MNNLAVIVPFYNEENYLQKSINRLIDSDIFDQIILVDDCSTDNSASIANENVLKINKMIYLKSSSNKGKGNALNLAKNIIETSHVIIHDLILKETKIKKHYLFWALSSVWQSASLTRKKSQVQIL